MAEASASVDQRSRADAETITAYECMRGKAKSDDMEIDSPLELSNTEEAVQQPMRVFEGTFSLLPICYHVRFMLTTADPEQDLRWWLGIRASTHDHQDASYISNKRFTDEILRSTIVEAVSQLLHLHVEINHLLRYAKRAYDIAPKQNVIKDADGSILSLGEEDVAEMPREELLETLVHLSTELDYLVEKKGIVDVTVLKAINKLAEGGSGVDRECLWRLGYCDEVDKMI
ncbi:hypothetical protein LTR15_012367 [Elasticomyces elasticus]|nr:hypothetical protein LTR15_012367 [Elasticomyces elasticus]